MLCGKRVMVNKTCAGFRQNKANSRPRDGRPARPRFYPPRVPGAGPAYKQSQFVDAPRDGRGRPRTGAPAGSDCAKQSQFGWSAGAPEREMRKTNPICHPPHWDRRDRSRETNPIGRGVSSLKLQVLGNFKVSGTFSDAGGILRCQVLFLTLGKKYLTPLVLPRLSGSADSVTVADIGREG